MKILIINEKLIEGGAEQSCLKTKEVLEQHKNEVYYLTFDNEFDSKIKNIKNKKNIFNCYVSQGLINKMFLNPFLYIKIRKIVKRIKPEKIILNNIFSSPITQMKALKGFDVYQVIRDYSIICPKSTLIKTEYDICKGYKYEKCVNECTYHNSKIKIRLKLNLIKRTEKIRKRIVKKVISPSEKLNEYLLDYNYNSDCINNPVKIPKEINKEKKNISKSKKYIYIGGVNENKGVFKLLNVYKEFSKNKDVNLKIIGKCSSEQDEKMLKKYLEDNSKIEFLGYKQHDETVKEIEDSEFIIVPSLWIENYPTTALEGMLYKCLVLGSNRGGIPEIVGNNRGLLFNILDEDSINDTLEKSYSMGNEEYEKIINNAYEYVISNNSYEKYYERIMKILKE